MTDHSDRSTGALGVEPAPSDLLLASLFERSRGRDALNWLKRHLWAVSESGMPGWLGDRCDDLEHRLLRRRGLANLRRRVGQAPGRVQS
jgi:hypothetical protein